MDAEKSQELELRKNYSNWIIAEFLAKTILMSQNGEWIEKRIIPEFEEMYSIKKKKTTKKDTMNNKSHEKIENNDDKKIDADKYTLDDYKKDVALINEWKELAKEYGLKTSNGGE